MSNGCLLSSAGDRCRWMLDLQALLLTGCVLGDAELLRLRVWWSAGSKSFVLLPGSRAEARVDAWRTIVQPSCLSIGILDSSMWPNMRVPVRILDWLVRVILRTSCGDTAHVCFAHRLGRSIGSMVVVRNHGLQTKALTLEKFLRAVLDQYGSVRPTGM